MAGNPLPRDDIAAAIRAKHVHTAMDRVRVYQPDDTCDHVHGEMMAAGYDYALVGRDGVAERIVTRAGLRPTPQPVEHRALPISGSDLIGADTPLPGVLQALSERTPFLLTVSGVGIAGVLTPSDLNKQPGRTYYYLLVAALEMNLADLARQTFSDQAAALAMLSPNRRESARQRLDKAVADDVVADEVSALDLTDLLELSYRLPGIFNIVWGDLSKTAARRIGHQMIDLRHDVMHPTRTLASDTPASLKRLVRLDSSLREVLSHFDSGGARRP